jgi:hypothetical protein
MAYGDSDWLENRIRIIEKGVTNDREIFCRGIALEEIVEFCGWSPNLFDGKMMGLSIGRVIDMFKGNIRKTNESYAQHCIMSLREVTKVCEENNIKDITLALGALNHDNIEESYWYKTNKKDFINETDFFKKEKIARDIEKVKWKYKRESDHFFNKFDPGLIKESGLDRESLFGIEVGLTKRPDEYYHEYLERNSGRKNNDMPRYDPIKHNQSRCDPVLNILRMMIIKAGGDRWHNNSTVPRQESSEQKTGFTIPQRLKECYKSLMVGNRIGKNFMFDFPDAAVKYPLYLDCLKESKNRLIGVSKGVLSEDIEYLSPIIGEKTKSIVDSLFNNYKDYAIRKPATENEILGDNKRVFDGTLARFDTWVKTYRGDATGPENIRLNPGNERWMKEKLGVTEPDMRAAVQAYMDCRVLKAVFEKFEADPNYTLKGFRKINR